MRETATLAQSYRRQELPARLMPRLDLMQHYALLATGQTNGEAAGAVRARRAPRRSAQAIIVLAWFSLGVLASGAAGVGVVAGSRALGAGGMPLSWSAWAKAPPVSSLLPDARVEEQGDVIQVAIDRGARAHAPFGLQVTGTDDPALEVFLRGVPAGVRPSQGEPVAPTIWVLKRADLDGLYLMLDAMAPEAFDLIIDVVMPSRIASTSSIVQVRLVDEAVKQAAMPGADRALDALDQRATDVARSAAAYVAAAGESPPVESKTGGLAQPRRASTMTVEASKPATPPTVATSWPDGASGLGAVPR